jgi:hypothetical protein
MLSWCPSAKRPPLDDERHARPPQTIRQRRIGKRDDEVAVGLEVAMQIADQVAQTGGFLKRPRPGDDDFFGRSRDDIRARGVAVDDLARLEDGAGRQFERQPGAVRRLDDSPHAPTVVRRHRQFDDADGSVCRRFRIGGLPGQLLDENRVGHQNRK